MLTLLATADNFQTELRAFRSDLQTPKQSLTAPQPGWYPFNSFTGMEVGLELWRPIYSEFARAMNGKPVANIGCGNGDLALLFAHWGATVNAIDHPPTNYSQMQGVERLSQAMSASVTRHRWSLDSRFEFSEHYGFALFLGALNQLQNPYYLLERLAYHADWCLWSTRVAQEPA